MTCKEVEALLLEDRRACHEEAVGRHLEACPSCRSLSQELEAIEELSSKLGRTQKAPDHFSDCLLEKAASIRASRSKSMLSTALKPAAALLGCLALALGAAWIHQQSTQAMPNQFVQDDDGLSRPDQVSEDGIRSLGHDDESGYVDVYFQRPSQEPHIVRLPDTIQVKGRQVDYARAHSY